MKLRTMTAALMGLLIAGSTAGANANMILPGFGAGFPDPLTDATAWTFNFGALQLAATDADWHYFDMSLPIKDTGFGGNLTVTWRHDDGCLGATGLCLVSGSGEVRVLGYAQNGTLAVNSGWIATTGNPVQSIALPTGGSAMLQVRMKAVNGTNTHVITRVVTSGQASL